MLLLLFLLPTADPPTQASQWLDYKLCSLAGSMDEHFLTTTHDACPEKGIFHLSS